MLASPTERELTCERWLRVDVSETLRIIRLALQQEADSHHSLELTYSLRHGGGVDLGSAEIQETMS